MKVKVRLTETGKMPLVSDKGDLFDVFAAESKALNGPVVDVNNNRILFDNDLIDLGFAMEIPKGFKANLLPRSSTYKKWKIIFANHVGQIDNSYCGNDDIWKASVIAFDNTLIKKGDKIAQFEIVPSSKATIWQKIKWLFSNRIKFVQVWDLNNEQRGGFGSTGSK